jgi:hypothetical protein
MKSIALISRACLVILAALITALLITTNTSAAEPYSSVHTPAIAQLTTDTVTITVGVTVTNSSDVVNGDTSSITALIGNPGPDGISFREALSASNNTPGPKAIEFAPALAGATITFASNGELLLLSSGGLTINGDINRDGIPDITLDGHLGQGGTPAGAGLSIVSSNNTISGINFIDFASAIQIACPDGACGTKIFASNKIVNNNISSPRGAGISIGPLGLRPAEEAPLFSDITWQDTVMSENTIASKGPTIAINSAVGGGDRNQIVDLAISGNHLSSGADVALAIVASGANSAIFGIPGPTLYSDDSLIRNLTVAGNTIAGENGAMYIDSAAGGGIRNQIINFTVSGNHQDFRTPQ